MALPRPLSRRHDSAVEITSAPRTRAQEQAERQRRYAYSMTLRTLCFVGAVAVGPGILRWVLIAGAVFLPYIAVVLANARKSLAPGQPQGPGPGAPGSELPAGPGDVGFTPGSCNNQP